MDFKTCRSAINGFADIRVLVIGDLMLDEHIWGTVDRISPEAPVMVVNVDSTEGRAGGAANVANNIRALGAQATIVGVIGDDEGGAMLRSCLEESGVNTGGLIVDKRRTTTRKTRIWASHRQQVVRVDQETQRKVSAGTIKRIAQFINETAGDVDAILVSDYDKGVVSREVVAAVVASANKYGKVSTSNPKPRSVHNFAGIGVMTLNQSEASAASRIEIADVKDAEKAGKKLISSVGCRSVVITRGGQGLSVFDGNKNPFHMPAVETEVYDVAGAGDTVIGALTLALACGLSLDVSAAVANCAAGAVVRKVGVATTTVDEISALLCASWDRFGLQ
ncbi:MAG: PfkB family carbohydrate kinase [Armatimonadetes bacterium]|nr:PfkB family carbohydrate kinase [Armatimonadota bacterium]